MPDLSDVAKQDQLHAEVEAWFLNFVGHAAHHIHDDGVSEIFNELCDAIVIWEEEYPTLKANQLAAAAITYIAQRTILICPDCGERHT